MNVVIMRRAVDADVPRLVAIEVAAGRLFREVGMTLVADHEPDPDELAKFVRDGRAWVIDVAGTPVGYALAEVLDGNAHVAQVSVDPTQARRSFGRRLVSVVEAWGQELGCPATTLTTFTHVPWNAPLYRRLGYEVLAPDLIGPQLRRAMEHESSLPGIDAGARCAMVKHNPRTVGSQLSAG